MKTQIKVPLFDLNYDEHEEKEILNTIRSKWISIGPQNEKFENLFAEMLGVKHAVAISSCTGALHIALSTIGINSGDEIICPSLTFVATANSIKFVNANPIFCDITSIENPTINPEKIKELITPKTKAILVMHYGGFPCSMDEIIDICKKNNLKLIEDACHAPLSKYKGRTIGTESDIACYSFFSNKNISTGEGGMIVTNNNYYNNKARLLRSHGMTSLSYERSKGHSTGYDVVELGFNYRLDDMRASLGIAQLQKLKKDIQRRMELRKLYIEQLSEIDELVIPFKDQMQFSSNYIFPVVLKDSNYIERGSIRCYLSKKGIQTSIHYPAVHQFRIYNHQYYDLPVTEYFASTEITLPLYSNLSEENLLYVCSSIKEAIYKSRNEKKTFTSESNQ